MSNIWVRFEEAEAEIAELRARCEKAEALVSKWVPRCGSDGCDEVGEHLIAWSDREARRCSKHVGDAFVNYFGDHSYDQSGIMVDECRYLGSTADQIREACHTAGVEWWEQYEAVAKMEEK